jgi:hypothetical protein
MKLLKTGSLKVREIHSSSLAVFWVDLFAVNRRDDRRQRLTPRTPELFISQPRLAAGV